MSKLTEVKHNYPAWLEEQLSVSLINKAAQIERWQSISSRCLLIQGGKQTLKVKYGETPAEAYLLQREALWLNRLNTLELTRCKCLDFYKNGQQSYLLSNFISGLSATQWLREEGQEQIQDQYHVQDEPQTSPQQLSQYKSERYRRLATYLESILDHIQAIHRHHWVHGDIKPSNMIFGTGNTASLIDFSNMRRVGEPWQERGFQQFSPSFVHPSQFPVATKEQDYYAYLLSVVALFDVSQIPRCNTVSGLMKVIDENTSKWHLPDLFNQQLLKLL